VCTCEIGEREPERAGEASEAVRDAQRGPTTTRRRAEQRAAGRTRRRAENAGRTSQTPCVRRRTAGAQRRAGKREQTTFGQVLSYIRSSPYPASVAQMTTSQCAGSERPIGGAEFNPRASRNRFCVRTAPPPWDLRIGPGHKAGLSVDA